MQFLNWYGEHYILGTIIIYVAVHLVANIFSNLFSIFKRY